MASQHQVRPSLDGIDPAEEQRISGVISTLRTLRETTPSTHAETNSRIEAARTIITTINASTFMTWSDRYDDQVFIITELQNLAYHDLDGVGTQDIAQWCIRQYLQILNQSRDDSVEALAGLGRAWLLRAQSTLGRIHRLEGSSSSGSSAQRTSGSAGRMSFTSSEDARENARALIEADDRAGTSDYVEARGMLLPSTEYFQRAVNAAERKQSLTGDLLSLAAEAYMSLGNVSYSHHNEQYFQQAIRYLRMGSSLQGYQLSPYLRSYLDEFGRLVP